VGGAGEGDLGQVGQVSSHENGMVRTTAWNREEGHGKWRARKQALVGGVKPVNHGMKKEG